MPEIIVLIVIINVIVKVVKAVKGNSKGEDNTSRPARSTAKPKTAQTLQALMERLGDLGDVDDEENEFDQLVEEQRRDARRGDVAQAFNPPIEQAQEAYSPEPLAPEEGHYAPAPRRAAKVNLTAQSARQAFMMKEILDKPVSMRGGL